MLGAYIHTHWGYNRPYAARAWSLADWEGYLEGLHGIGYDFLMIWPLLDSMPARPNASDYTFLGRVAQAIKLAQQWFGMRVAVIICPNTIGNARADHYTFTERPYFLCEEKVNPADKAAVAAFLEGRRRQLEPLAGANALAIIDSDPGGYVGSTNDEFVALLRGQIGVFREFNPSAELMYWMFFGWENYNRFWAAAQARKPEDPPVRINLDPAVYTETLTLIQRQISEPWSLFACHADHVDVVTALQLEAKTLAFPYGLVEGEPTFPLTEWDSVRLERGLDSPLLRLARRGAMANAQTHCLQLPHMYLFAHLARGGTLENMDLAGFAEQILPGLGEPVAAGWQALTGAEPDKQWALAQGLRQKVENDHSRGKLAGLLFGDSDRFLVDLAMNLELRAALTEFAQSAQIDSQAIRKVLAVLRPYQRRLGFVDAYHGPLYEKLNVSLMRLSDPRIRAVLDQFSDWRNPGVRQGILPRLLDALEAFCDQAK